MLFHGFSGILIFQPIDCMADDGKHAANSNVSGMLINLISFKCSVASKQNKHAL